MRCIYMPGAHVHELADELHLNEGAKPAAVIHQICLLLMRMDCLLSYAGSVRKDVFVRHGRHGSL